jgi:hypothetical protein
MIHPSVEDLQKAIDNAEYDAMDFFSMLRESTLLVPADEHINARDAMYIQRSIAYVVLGLTSITESVDDILTTLEGDEFSILTYIKSVFALAPVELTTQIKKYPINLASEAEDRLLISDTDSKTETISTRTPYTEATTNRASIGTSTETFFSRESVLHEIENPHETVKAPEYVFPKTKPTTSDTLRTLTSTEQTNNDAISIIDPFKKAPIINTTEPVIVDPFKKPSSSTSSSIPSSAPQPVATPTQPLATPHQSTVSEPLQYTPPVIPPSPASVIQDNLNKKLNSVTGIGAKESFKTHDPYREPIGK